MGRAGIEPATNGLRVLAGNYCSQRVTPNSIPQTYKKQRCASQCWRGVRNFCGTKRAKNGALLPLQNVRCPPCWSPCGSPSVSYSVPKQTVGVVLINFRYRDEAVIAKARKQHLNVCKSEGLCAIAHSARVMRGVANSDSPFDLPQMVCRHPRQAYAQQVDDR